MTLETYQFPTIFSTLFSKKQYLFAPNRRCIQASSFSIVASSQE